jgi:hypothetical protein
MCALLASVPVAVVAREGAYEFACVLRFHAGEEGMEATYNVAGIDVHKKMLAVVITNARDTELTFEDRRFGTTLSELRRLCEWLKEHRESITWPTLPFSCPFRATKGSNIVQPHAK